MSLEKKINDDMKEAMKARDKNKLEALRGIKSALLLEKTGKDQAAGEIPEEIEVKLLQKQLKQRKESAEVYKAQGRDDLADYEMFQASIIESYLPEQMSEEELRGIVEDIIKETGAESMKDMGKVMGAATKKLGGKADNKAIAAIVKEKLGA
ncbi:MAG: GatB/YqeY domain-containing protein [Bacteroidales bacterium]|nr:GatB/YqeY domain-containing protein [Bacteroidales bacterium]